MVESSAGEWTRVDPFTRVYPRDAWGFAQPGLVKNEDHATRADFPSKMIVLGTDKVYSQLLHRASLPKPRNTLHSDTIEDGECSVSGVFQSVTQAKNLI